MLFVPCWYRMINLDVEFGCLTMFHSSHSIPHYGMAWWFAKSWQIFINLTWPLTFVLLFVLKQVAASVLLQSDKVEGLGVAASFMSEQSLLYLGLLGEYSRATRKRHKLPFHCMHQEPIWSSCSEVSFAGAQSQPGFLQGSAATLGSGFCHIW